MMKPISSDYVLIYVSSDVGCFDQDEIIKAGKSCCAGGTCQKIGRRAGGSVDVSTEGFRSWTRALGQEDRYCAKDIGVAESTSRLGNRL